MKKSLLKTYLQIAVTTGLLAGFVLFFVLLLGGIVAYFAVAELSTNNMNRLDIDILVRIASVAGSFMLIIAGLFTFIYAASQFIRAYRSENYEYLSSGMAWLNWGWAALGVVGLLSFLGIFIEVKGSFF